MKPPIESPLVLDHVRPGKLIEFCIRPGMVAKYPQHAKAVEARVVEMKARGEWRERKAA